MRQRVGRQNAVDAGSDAQVKPSADEGTHCPGGNGKIARSTRGEGEREVIGNRTTFARRNFVRRYRHRWIKFVAGFFCDAHAKASLLIRTEVIFHDHVLRNWMTIFLGRLE